MGGANELASWKSKDGNVAGSWFALKEGLSYIFQNDSVTKQQPETGDKSEKDNNNQSVPIRKHLAITIRFCKQNSHLFYTMLQSSLTNYIKWGFIKQF